jgi:hypothetical protein
MFKREFRWYLEAQDDHTNSVFAENLSDTTSMTELNVLSEPEPVLVWEASRKWVTFFEKSRVNAHLDFRIWVQKGNGKPHLWRFDENKIKAIKSVQRIVKSQMVRSLNRIH